MHGLCPFLLTYSTIFRDILEDKRINCFCLTSDRWSNLIPCLQNIYYLLHDILPKLYNHTFVVAASFFFWSLCLQIFNVGSGVQQMPPSHFLLYLYACCGSRGGGHYASWLNDLMGHTSAVELQMRRKGGLARMAASSICITCVSVAALSLTDPQCLSSAKSTKYPWIPQPEL